MKALLLGGERLVLSVVQPSRPFGLKVVTLDWDAVLVTLYGIEEA